MKTRTIVILSIVMLLLGFLIGRLSVTDKTIVKTKEVVKNVPSSYIVRDTIFSPMPALTYCKVDTCYIKKVDTCYIEKVDTAEILCDYFLNRQYKLDFSNDSIGKFIVNAEVNQNKLVSANSFVQPITKFIYKENAVTKQTVKTFQPWITIGTNVNLDCQQVTLGFDLKQKYIFGVSGFRFKDKYNYTVNIGIKW